MNDLTSVLLVTVAIMLIVMVYKYNKTVNLLNYAVWKNDTKNDIKFRVVTKEEFLIKSMRDGLRKEDALRYWNTVSKGYNFILAKGDVECYSVEYVNEYLG